jgi:hypothetical protein
MTIGANTILLSGPTDRLNYLTPRNETEAVGACLFLLENKGACDTLKAAKLSSTLDSALDIHCETDQNLPFVSCSLTLFAPELGEFSETQNTTYSMVTFGQPKAPDALWPSSSPLQAHASLVAHRPPTSPTPPPPGVDFYGSPYKVVSGWDVSTNDSHLPEYDSASASTASASIVSSDYLDVDRWTTKADYAGPSMPKMLLFSDNWLEMLAFAFVVVVLSLVPRRPVLVKPRHFTEGTNQETDLKTERSRRRSKDRQEQQARKEAKEQQARKEAQVHPVERSPLQERNTSNDTPSISRSGHTSPASTAICITKQAREEAKQQQAHKEAKQQQAHKEASTSANASAPVPASGPVNAQRFAWQLVPCSMVMPDSTVTKVGLQWVCDHKQVEHLSDEQKPERSCSEQDSSNGLINGESLQLLRHQLWMMVMLVEPTFAGEVTGLMLEASDQKGHSEWIPLLRDPQLLRARVAKTMQVVMCNRRTEAKRIAEAAADAAIELEC